MNVEDGDGSSVRPEMEPSPCSIEFCDAKLKNA